MGGEDTEHIKTLAEVKERLPPILVDRRTMRVIDGMHRLRAAALCGESSIEATFFDGDDTDVFVRAVQENVTHGLPLSTSDRTAAAVRVIGSHPRWSDRKVASVVGLSDKTVASIRRCSTAETPQSNSRVGRDGRIRPASASEGRMRAHELLSTSPDASLREIAQSAGIAVSTASDVRKRLRSGQDPMLPRQRGPLAARTATTADDDLSTYSIADTVLTLNRLKRDPSLCLNKIGRTLLRLLDVHSLEPKYWDHIIDNLPEHCVETVAQAARKCSNSWLYFARNLEKRRNPSADSTDGW